MSSKPKHFARYLRQLKYLSKRCAEYQNRGISHKHIVLRVRNKLRFLLLKLKHHVAPGHWISAAACVVAFLQTCGTPLQAQHFLDPVTNPFQISEVFEHLNHNIVDIDNDGDMDILTTGYNDSFDLELRFLENVSDVQTPDFAAPALVPLDFQGPDPNYFFYDLGDLDGDGDLDMIALVDYAEFEYSYSYEPIIAFIENIGTPESASFQLNHLDTLTTAVPIRGIGLPHLADIDNDGDLDMFLDTQVYSQQYDYEIRLIFYENSGTPGQFEFTQGILEPFNYQFPKASQYMIHAFGDLDTDGDLDILALSAVYENETNDYTINYVYYENTGDAMTPDFAPPLFDQFNLPDEERFPTPCVPVLADWDLDADLDLSCSIFEGPPDGVIFFFENIGTSGFGSQDQMALEVIFQPNPSRQYFEIFLDNITVGDSEIAISDIRGQEIFAGKTNNGYLMVQCGHWATGSYVVHISSNELNAVRIIEVIR